MLSEGIFPYRSVLYANILVQNPPITENTRQIINIYLTFICYCCLYKKFNN